MGCLPYAALGEGPPIAVLAGLSPTTGVGGKWGVWTMLGPVASLAGSHRLFVFNRRPHLPRGFTMGAIAAEHADALREGFGAPVDLLGASTGGSIAQQLAADHPEIVRRLVLISTACRLGEWGRTLQRRVAARVRAGAHRQALAVLAADLVPSRPVGIAAGAGAWLLGPSVIRGPDDLDDMATTIEAEDTFDLANCERPITAPTLIVVGREDQCLQSRAVRGDRAADRRQRPADVRRPRPRERDERSTLSPGAFDVSGLQPAPRGALDVLA